MFFLLASRLGKARKAYNKKNLEEMKKAHTKKAISKEEHQIEQGRYLKDYVYGALDGIVTTFAVVSGVTGASLSVTIILILGFANLLADGISMSVGNYLGSKSEIDYYKKERSRESWEIDNYPKGEKEEVRQIYMKKGFKGKDLEMIVKTITADKKLWIDEMMKDELKMMREEKSPAKAGLATFIAFVAAGFIPLLSYVIALSFPFIIPFSFEIAVLLTAITIFAVGSIRCLFIEKSWYRAGLEMLVVGGLAAIAAYYIGFLISGFVGI